MNLKSFVLAVSGPNIEFLCHKEDFGAIPKPKPAAKFLPAWFKSLDDKIPGGAASTIKRCMPFLDSMALGYIIPLAADVEFATNDDASEVTYKSNFHRSLVERHAAEQLNREEHPDYPKPPLKFMNYWAIKVPKGYSVLFVPPLNRHETRFQCLSGLVDCDGYFEFVNFPFIFHEKNYAGVVKAGAPLMQVIPIKRCEVIKRHGIGALADTDLGIYLPRTHDDDLSGKKLSSRTPR